MARRNPAPLNGAIFVRNPRRRKNTRRRNVGTRRNTAVKRLLNRIRNKARTNSRKRNTSRRKNWSLRKNGLKRLRNGRFTSLKRNSRRRYNKRRNTYGRKRNYSRRRNTGRRRNGDLTTRAASIVSKWTRKLPFGLGKMSKYLAPALTGAATVVPIHFALKYAAPYLPEQVKPIGYTLGGIGVGLLASFLPGKLTGNFKNLLGLGAVTVGAAIDAYRYIQGSSYELGDGMAYDLYGAIDVPGYQGLAVGGDVGAVELLGDYSGVVMADAAWSGPDLSSYEIGAALAGAGAWRGRFKPPAKIARRQAGQMSALAGKPGHRWGWLVRLVGWENFRKIAALPAAQRQALIRKIRKDAVAAVVGLSEADVQIETAGLGLDMSGLGTPLFAGAAY
jgi:hypothetical protein